MEFEDQTLEFQKDDEQIDHETTCRICLTASAEQYIAVDDEVLGVKIVDLLFEISGSSICLDAAVALSSLICTDCCKDLQKAIRLRRLFLRSEAYLLKLDHTAFDADPFLLDDFDDLVFVDKPVDEIEEEKDELSSKDEPPCELQVEFLDKGTVHLVDSQHPLFSNAYDPTDKRAVLLIPPERLRLTCCMCYHLADTEEELIAHLFAHPERARRSEYRKQVDKALPDDRKQGRKICIKCMKAFYVKKQLDAHLKAFYLDQKFQCSFCGSRFGYHDKLKEHERRCLRKVVVGKRLEQCPTCQKMLTKSALAEHARIHSMTAEERIRFKCETCQRGYPTKRALKIHLIQHMTTRSKKCHICDKVFKTTSNLTAHIRVHYNERIYNCSYCDNTYIHASDRNRHEKSVHTGERPHKCEHCSKGFVKRYSLTVHLRTCQAAPRDEKEDSV